MRVYSSCCFLLGCIATVIAKAVEYNELLEITPLPDNYLHASFSFNSSAELSENTRHYDIFPRSLIQLARKAHARSLHLRFTRGRWNQEIWGALPHQGRRHGGSGIEVWAELRTIENANDQWVNLVNSLSGLFCASMNFIDSTRTVMPRLAFHGEVEKGIKLFYGVLPSETVCTENLTPFLKLLPCKGRAGISSLLTGHKMFETDWSALAIDVDMSKTSAKVAQSVDMVFDIERATFAARDPIPGSQPSEDLVCEEGKAYTSEVTCFPKDGRQSKDWSLVQIFGRPLNGHCAVQESAATALLVNHGPETRLVPHSPFRTQNTSSYLLQDEELNLQYSDRSDIGGLAAPIEVHRSLTSHGSSLQGKITLSIVNSKDEAVDIVYFSVLPWFMRPYLHSLRTSDEVIIKNTIYRPAKDRIRPTHLELKLRVPSRKTILVTFDFDRTILRYAEYPPDANRGFDVPAAVIVMNNGEYTARTTSLLLALPTPDFSMPYNVIILTCTVVALCFGSMFNLLSRRIALASEVPPQLGLKDKLLRFVSKFMSKSDKPSTLQTNSTTK